MDKRVMEGKFAIRTKPTVRNGIFYLLKPVFIYQVLDKEMIIVSPTRNTFQIPMELTKEKAEILREEGKVIFIKLDGDYVDENWELYDRFLERTNDIPNHPNTLQLKQLEGKLAIRAASFLNGIQLFSKETPIYIHKVSDDYLVFFNIRKSNFPEQKQYFSLEDLLSIEEKIMAKELYVEIMPNWMIDGKWNDYQSLFAENPNEYLKPRNLSLSALIGKKIVRSESKKEEENEFTTKPLLLVQVTNAHMICYDPWNGYNEKYGEQGLEFSVEELFELAKQEKIQLSIFPSEWIDGNWIEYDELLRRPNSLSNPASLYLNQFVGTYILRQIEGNRDRLEVMNQPLYLFNVTDTHIVVYAPHAYYSKMKNINKGIEVDPKDTANIHFGIQIGLLDVDIFDKEWLDKKWVPYTSEQKPYKF